MDGGTDMMVEAKLDNMESRLASVETAMGAFSGEQQEEETAAGDVGGEYVPQPYEQEAEEFTPDRAPFEIETTESGESVLTNCLYYWNGRAYTLQDAQVSPQGELWLVGIKSAESPEEPPTAEIRGSAPSASEENLVFAVKLYEFGDNGDVVDCRHAVLSFCDRGVESLNGLTGEVAIEVDSEENENDPLLSVEEEETEDGEKKIKLMLPDLAESVNDITGKISIVGAGIAEVTTEGNTITINVPDNGGNDDGDDDNGEQEQNPCVHPGSEDNGNGGGGVMERYNRNSYDEPGGYGGYGGRVPADDGESHPGDPCKDCGC